MRGHGSGRFLRFIAGGMAPAVVTPAYPGPGSGTVKPRGRTTATAAGHDPIRWRRAIGAVLLVAGSLIDVARAGTVAVDLRSEYDVRIWSARAAHSVGDVNGDGIPDLYVAGPWGRWVIFGQRPMSRRFKLRTFDGPGFEILGRREWAANEDVAAAGDVNGDGLDDIIFGRGDADNNGRSRSGSAYVVFGKTDSDPVDLDSFDRSLQGDAGFRIDGADAGDAAGESVAGLGDVDGDGLADVVVGAPFAGAAYAVFGKTDTRPVDLRSYERDDTAELQLDLGMAGTRGFRISTKAPRRWDQEGLSVGGAGDVNGDESPDVIVGIRGKPKTSGKAYVVFGKKDGSSVNTREAGDWGFKIEGFYRRSHTGFKVTAADDVNGDGLDDVLVSAPVLNALEASSVYVVFGKTDTQTVDLAEVAAGSCCGFRIHGLSRHVEFFGPPLTGLMVDGIGDINGDGLDDVVVDAPQASFNGRYLSGSVFVVYGKKGFRTIELEQIGNRGFRIDGAGNYDEVGQVGGLSDFGGDGIPDILMAAEGAPGEGDRLGRDAVAGAAYILYGRR
ncbi:MAG: VCBS repeat-containing protein [Actinomycetota bacterium]|nr:VCBS repeat-containing protein [Actinomycetota bacterium]